MVTNIIKEISIKEFLALPETKPASEYLNGKIIQKPMPKGKHSIIQGELIIALNTFFKIDLIARAFPELRCTFGNRSIVPDISVFQLERIPRDENGEIVDNFEIAPDWVIEILSPDQSSARVTKNILHCLNNGTKLGWLIHPNDRSVLVYYPERQPAFFESNTDVLPVPDFAKSFELTLENLFDWLKL
ncbi:MAG: Uma2 family endonuclease [Prochloraceae cyanobacterium]|nr:Uma2 family endonuclease [Prochloraceae cyanobacterium]